MRILDINDNEIFNPDYELGYTQEEEIFIQHHDAIEEIQEEWHWNVIKEYDNGGKDVEKVVDVPAVEAQDEWDEYETILRYYEYTQEEIEQKAEERLHNELSLEERINDLEIAICELMDALA